MPLRFALALPPALLRLLGTGAAAPAMTGVVPARTSCDADGRCYETGDPASRDDVDRPAPKHRFDRDDDPASSSPRRRFDRDDD